MCWGVQWCAELTYGPMGRVLPLWSRPPGPQISLSMVSVPRFPLSPTNRLFLISCFEPSSWGKVPPLEKRAGGERAAHTQTQPPAQAVPHSCIHSCIHSCTTHLYTHLYHTAVPHSPCQSQPNAIVSKPAKRREMLQKRSGMLWFVMSNCNKQTGLGQQGLITARCSGGAGAFPDLFPVQV